MASEWLLPYLIGRLYFTDTDGLRELTTGMIIGAACLIPACIFENRMTTILLPMVYGINPITLGGSRLGGYRPRVFFARGLELALWMNVAALAAFWLWRTKQLKPIRGFSSRTIFVSLFIVAFLCRSAGATVLLFGGMGMLWICQRTTRNWAMWCVLLLAPLYYSVRIPNIWSGDNAVELVRATLGEDRAGSLWYRMHFENPFIAHALVRPAFGWDGWGRNLVADETGYKPGIDSLWVITFGCNGYVGLSTMTTAMLLPVLLFLLRFPVGQWLTPGIAPAAALAVTLNLFMRSRSSPRAGWSPWSPVASLELKTLRPLAPSPWKARRLDTELRDVPRRIKGGLPRQGTPGSVSSTSCLSGRRRGPANRW
jgi:hypothetical protein